MTKSKVYWKGMCEKCFYAIDFSLRPSLYWFCDYYKKDMAQVQGCSGPKEREDRDE